MPKFISTTNQLKDITDEIVKGIQSGSMAVERIDVRWSGNVQRYVVEVIDHARTSRLAQLTAPLTPPSLFTSAASVWSGPASISSVPWTPAPASEIQDLGVSTEPIIGFRDFYLGGTGVFMPCLLSRNKAPWPKREPMRAFCKSGALSRHDAPDPGCECGIYAFSKPGADGLETGAVIWGEIAMWGEVLIAPHGYRSEFAYPKTLFIQDTGAKKSVAWLRDVLADGYGVPVFIVEKKEGKTASQIISEMIEAGL